MADEPLPTGPARVALSSEAEIEQATDRIIALARQRIAIFDKALSSSWDRAARIEPIRRLCLANPRNTMKIALHDADSMLRRTPRLAALLGPFGHVMAIHRTREEVAAVSDPLIVVDDRHFLHRFHVDVSRAVLVTNDPAATRALAERFSQIWSASEPGLSGTTLGL